MVQLDTGHLDTGPARPGRSRRLHDAAAQQRVLLGMGVEVSLKVLQELPPGGWVRFVPKDALLRIARRFDRD